MPSQDPDVRSPDRPSGRPPHWDEVLAGLRHLLGPISEARAEELVETLEWVRVRRGDAVVSEGEPSDAVYLLLAGRLRAVRENGGDPVAVGDITVGESVGEMGVFTGELRSATVYAIRESQLIRFPKDRFEELLQEHPEATLEIMRTVVGRLRRQYDDPAVRPPREIAVVPLTPTPDVRDLGTRLARALGRDGPVRALSSAQIDTRLGGPGAAQAEEGEDARRLARWLDEATDGPGHTLYLADGDASAWSRRCIARADHVLLVADATADPEMREIERALLRLGPRASAPRRSLVLVHPSDTDLPRGTAAWLDPRELDEHYHLRGLGHSQVARLARYLCGRSVGVVLGGGGARGWAHIGVLRALREAGIPIDRVGGTSVGSAMAAQVGMGWGDREMIDRGRAAWLDLAPHREFTLPVFSVLRGRKAEQAARMVYGDTRIEDLWIPCFAISTNITRARMEVHRRGHLGTAVTASATVPGAFTPVIDDGDLLVDGGVVNNLPVDVMREAGAGRIIAVDVSGATEPSFKGKAFPSPWVVIRDRLLRRPPVEAPRLGDVILRCTVIGSAYRVAHARRDADLYLQPPVQDIGMMEFDSLDRAVEIGYQYSREAIQSIRSET